MGSDAGNGLREEAEGGEVMADGQDEDEGELSAH